MSLDSVVERTRITTKNSSGKKKPTEQIGHRIQHWSFKHSNLLSAVVGLCLVLLLWTAVVELGQYPAFILPAPNLVARKFIVTLGDGTLLRHLWTTLSELLLGLTVGMTTALTLGYMLGKSPKAERLVAPYIVASQSIPIVAIAPLLIIWFGSGLLSKVLICALITFFPILVNTIVGIRHVDAELHDLMRSMSANRWQTFFLLELPAAAPYLFSGLKLGVILSVVGAVVGEFVGADSGLGFLINLARGVLDTPLMFVAIISLIGLAQVLYLIVSLLETYFLRWHKSE